MYITLSFSTYFHGNQRCEQGKNFFRSCNIAERYYIIETTSKLLRTSFIVIFPYPKVSSWGHFVQGNRGLRSGDSFRIPPVQQTKLLSLVLI